MVADVDLRGNLLIHQLIARDDRRESEEWPI
jgi:hypothetical protein